MNKIFIIIFPKEKKIIFPKRKKNYFSKKKKKLFFQKEKKIIFPIFEFFDLKNFFYELVQNKY